MLWALFHSWPRGEGLSVSAEWIAALEVNRWVLLGIINLFLLPAGFFLPPVAVILMTAPILLPIIVGAGFDPYWLAIISR